MADLSAFKFLVMALFRAPLDELRSAAEQIVRDHFPPGCFEARVAPLDIALVYETRPARGGAHPKRAVFFEPGSALGTTALIANLEDGWLTMCNVLASRTSGEHLLVRSCIDHEYPLHDFEVWLDGKSVRHVAVIREDPDWEFIARGEPRTFEEPPNYQKRRISERVDRDVLVGYMRKLGWGVDAPDFWNSPQPAFYLFERPRHGS